MAVESITHKIDDAGRMRIFVTAARRTHHNSMAKAVNQYAAAQQAPTWEGAPGKWSMVRFDGFWQDPESQDERVVRKTFTSYPRHPSAEDCL